MENNKVEKHIITPKIRDYTIKKDELNRYKIPSTGLILEWKIETPGKFKLFFSDFHINIPVKNNIFNIFEMREYMRNLIPETEEEVKLDNIERTLYSTQLNAIEYYKGLKLNDFNSSIFTKDIKPIYFTLEGKKLDSIKITEKYYDRGTNIKAYDLESEV
jgi:hypothetical protein